MGGAWLGVKLAEWRAPQSFGAQFLALFMLPLSFISALSLWQGFALVALLFRFLLGRARRKPIRDPIQVFETLRRKAVVMIPVPMVYCTPCGIAVGLLGGNLVSTAMIFLITGFVYGVLLYLAAQWDLLPFLEGH